MRANGARYRCDSVCLMFAGQGSQYRQMGRELYEQSSVFRSRLHELDTIFQEELGISALSDLYDDHHLRSDVYDKTILTHPALFMVQLALAETLLANNVNVTGVIGASLGEFIASVIAGAIEAEDMMRAVVRAAIVMEAKCQEGGMLSVLGPEELYYQDKFVRDQSTFAGNYMNALFVLAGPKNSLKAIQSHFTSKDVTSVVLPVSRAFHSDALDVCQKDLLDIFSQLNIKPLKMSFFSSLTGGKLDYLSARHFVKVGREPINFLQALFHLLESNDFSAFIDVGPFGSLASVIKKTPGFKNHICHTILNPFRSSAETMEEVVRLMSSQPSSL
jgi:acyl transferase domain-containing protein